MIGHMDSLEEVVTYDPLHIQGQFTSTMKKG